MPSANVITVGVFDMLHEGHVNLIRAMSLHGSYRVALIHDDLAVFRLKGRFPVQPAELRKRNLELCGLVDAVGVVYDTDPSDAIQNEVKLLGGKWKFLRGDDMPDFPGRKEVERLNVPIVLVPYTEGISSSARRETECM